LINPHDKMDNYLDIYRGADLQAGGKFGLGEEF
jgi:hypothetical protein